MWTAPKTRESLEFFGPHSELQRLWASRVPLLFLPLVEKCVVWLVNLTEIFIHMAMCVTVNLWSSWLARMNPLWFGCPSKCLGQSSRVHQQLQVISVDTRKADGTEQTCCFSRAFTLLWPIVLTELHGEMRSRYSFQTCAGGVLWSLHRLRDRKSSPFKRFCCLLFEKAQNICNPSP